MFVFENVPGILSANNGGYLVLIFDDVKNYSCDTLSFEEKKL